VTATVKMVQTGEIVEYRDSTALGRLTYTSMFEEMRSGADRRRETMSSLIDAMDIGRIQLRARRVCSQGAPGLEISWACRRPACD
jgi:hypothetical protein